MFSKTAQNPMALHLSHKLAAIFGILLLIVIDQLSKVHIREVVMSNGGPMEILPFFNLVSVWNYGISFGLMQAGNDIGVYLLVGIAIIITAVFLIWMMRAHNIFHFIACVFVIGGAMGNVIDRVMFGAVFDFLDFHAFGYHWPAFNVADSCVFIGIAMVIIDGLFYSRDTGESS